MHFVLSKTSKEKMIEKIVKIAKIYETLRDREKKGGPILMFCIGIYAIGRVNDNIIWKIIYKIVEPAIETAKAKGIDLEKAIKLPICMPSEKEMDIIIDILKKINIDTSPIIVVTWSDLTAY